MPLIPALTLPSATLEASEIYDAAAAGGTGGVFKPANPPITFEVLNGALETANYAGGAGSVKPMYCVPGAFVRAFYLPFDDWHLIYAAQAGQDSGHGASETVRVYHAGLCSYYFLPWTAKLVLCGWQAYVRQDATMWDSGGAQPTEFWDARFRVADTLMQELYARFPHGRVTTDVPTSSPPAPDPGYHRETRWYWDSPFGLIDSGAAITPGDHLVRVSFWPGVLGPDPKKAKLLTPTGGLWMVAFR